MAYLSTHYSSHWTPDGDPSSFSATVGRIISHGGLEKTQRHAGTAAAAAALAHRQQSGQQQRGGGGGGPAADQPQASYGPRPGYSWVDPRGRLLIDGPPASRPPPPAPPRPPPPAAAALAALRPEERSARIWARISPGMLPGTALTPISTAAAAFSYPAGLIEPVDATHHLRKTDFSEYVEARERQHVSLKAKS